MTTTLNPIYVSNSQLFRVDVYDVDGVTLITPLSCKCSIFNADTDAVIVDNADGEVGSGYARYNWTGTATAGDYEAVLDVTIAADVIKTEHFRIVVKAKPPAFTTDLDSAIGQVRFHIGDDTEGAGVLPDGSNFNDNQITYALNDNGQNVLAAVARLCASLAARWSIVPDRMSVDSGAVMIDRSQRVKHWQEQERYFKQQAQGGTLLSVPLDRRDAWSVANASGGDMLIRTEDASYTDDYI